MYIFLILLTIFSDLNGEEHVKNEFETRILSCEHFPADSLYKVEVGVKNLSLDTLYIDMNKMALSVIGYELYYPISTDSAHGDTIRLFLGNEAGKVRVLSSHDAIVKKILTDSYELWPQAEFNLKLDIPAKMEKRSTDNRTLEVSFRVFKDLEVDYSIYNMENPPNIVSLVFDLSFCEN
jgi:hypothetical protein